MLKKFLVIFLLTGVIAGSQEQEENPFWETFFDEWSELEKVPDVDFNQQVFTAMIEIYNSIQRYIINGASVSNETKSEANALKIRPKIIERTVKHMKAALLNDSYSENEEILKLADAISKVNETLFDEIICSVIVESFLNIPMNKLIDDLSRHRNTSQNIAALLCIDSVLRNLTNLAEGSRLQLTGRIQNNTNLSAAQKSNIYRNAFESEGVETNRRKLTYKILEKLDDYENLRESYKIAVEVLINKLPTFVKNLYFAREVCIQSVAFQGHYLWKSDFIFNSGYNLTLHNGKPDYNASEGKWLVRRTSGGGFRVESKSIRNWFIKFTKVFETFSDSEMSSYYGAFAHEDTLLDDNLWQVDIASDGIYFYSRAIERYLCPLNVSSNFKIRGLIKSPDCLWVVEECKN